MEIDHATSDPGVASLIPARSHTFVEIDHATSDPGVVSLIPARSHTFMEIDHYPPSADSRRVVVSYNRKYVHEVLDNGLVKLAQEKRG